MSTLVKNDGTWKMPTKTYLKQDGAWTQVDGERDVVTFNGTTQYAVAPRVTEIDLDDPNLEFEIEWSGVLRETGSCYIMCDGGYGDYSEIRVGVRNQYGYLYFILGGAATILSVPEDYDYLSFDDFRITVSIPDNTVGLYINDTIVSTKTVTIGSGRFIGGVIIGGRWGGDSSSAAVFYEGQLSNLRIWTGGDRNTGTLTRDYRMDEGWRGANNQVLVNYATELGEELVVNGDFSDELEGWSVTDSLNRSSVLNAQFLVQGFGESGTDNVTASQEILLPSLDHTYLLSTNVESGQIQMPINGVFNSFIPVGISTQTVTPVSQKVQFKTFYFNESVTNSISYKQADGYGTYVGLTEASWSKENV